ncbi:hypothetical protein ACWD9K_30410 [Streptomyces sp. 900116325]
MFAVLAAMSGMEREYIRDRTLEGHESARKRGKTIGGAGVTDDMLSMALHLRGQKMSPRDMAKRLVITTGAEKGQHPSPASVMRMLREHDEQTTLSTQDDPVAPLTRISVAPPEQRAGCLSSGFAEGPVLMCACQVALCPLWRTSRSH